MPDSARMRALLSPRSVAVVGASDDPSRIGGRPLRILRDRGFTGELYPVNPKYDTVQGMPSFRSVTELPDGIDLYIVCVSSKHAVEAIEVAAKKGASAAVVFSGGFAEVGPDGRELQARLRAEVERSGIALVGPNSLGFASFANNSYATFATALAGVQEGTVGDIAIVSQSGGTAFNLMAEAAQANAKFSHVIATGNEAGLGFADYLDYLAEDPATNAVIGYVEGVADGAALGAALAKLRDAGKPVFVVKTGVSELGRRSVASHTAQMSGSDDAFDAVFHRHGAVRLTTMQEAIDVARALSLPTAADGVAVATNSGGAAAYLADGCDRHDVPLAELSAATAVKLREQLPAFAAVANPVDFTAQVINDNSLLERTLRVLDEDSTIDTLLVFLGSMGYLSTELWDILERLDAELTTPMVITWLGVSEDVRTTGIRRGLNVCSDPARVLRGLGLVRRARQAVSRRTRPVAAVRDTGSRGSNSPVDEWAAMDLLEREGVATATRRRVSDESELAAAAEHVGFPCVLKLVEPVLEHRAKVGAVKLGIPDATALTAAYRELVERFGMTAAVVARQYPLDAELIVGALRDETFGTRAVVGLGGVWTNAIDDNRGLVPPYTEDYVLDELRRLRGVDWLRQSTQVELGVIAAQVAEYLGGFQRILDSADDTITEIECNPLAVTPDGVLALDALAFRSGGGRDD